MVRKILRRNPMRNKYKDFCVLKTAVYTHTLMLTFLKSAERQEFWHSSEAVARDIYKLH